ncbi:hypothetical protein [Streptomyces scabiei]|uniref:hypothetical protein n=1 Tax=Streptomyces scabiei TaxID=1930 RepID=UPI001B3253D9|nr:MULTISPECIES: hypothetical protein [Streptomyces]MBP5892547.1 hypothetical protein [Streptomyces sp. LBUM 1481]MBP5922798.1 hypothetical protein [Streptomyces sp. LBUM 1483]MDX2689431.1 hypothetical protein [Streptomyces scabiei]MDX2753263.1 hypothetical protein [Streptomyces scabiei]MDX2807406.1 hypothetical protein [Streptomyces scabiei]
MNAWTIGSGTLALILTAVPIYFEIEDRATKEAAGQYTITTPGVAERVGLCLEIIKGTGKVPQKGKGSVWLVVHGEINVNDYRVVRQVQQQPGEEEWSISRIQVGLPTTPEGRRYELALWRFSEELTDAISHMPAEHRVFDVPPSGVTAVGATTVVRRPDKQPCDDLASRPPGASRTKA